MNNPIASENITASRFNDLMSLFPARIIANTLTRYNNGKTVDVLRIGLFVKSAPSTEKTYTVINCKSILNKFSGARIFEKRSSEVFHE
jgi:hypothetical protein